LLFSLLAHSQTVLGQNSGVLTRYSPVPATHIEAGNESPSVMASFVDPKNNASSDFSIQDSMSNVVFLNTEIFTLKPTLLDDIGTAAQWASESWWSSGNIERRFSEALSLAYIRDGNFATSVSSPYSVGPSQYRYEQDAKFRSEMAASLKHYMIVRGLPKFLSSREETKEIGKKYEKTMQQVATFASVKVETKAKWVLNSGFNPLNLVGWTSYSNKTWNFEANTRISNESFHFSMQRLDVFAQRSFKRDYAAEIRYKVQEKILINSMSKQIHPRLKTYFSNDIPFREGVKSSEIMTNTIGANYSF